MQHSRTILMTFALAVAAFAQTNTTTTSTRTFTFSPIGVAPSETAQITLINTASNTNNGTAASCTGSVSFQTVPNGGTGAAIGTATNFTLASNASSLVRLAGSGTARQEIRAVVTLTTTSNVPCSLNATVETYDTGSGATHVHLDTTQLNGFGR